MKAVLFDGPGCIGCRACVDACKKKYNLPAMDMSGSFAGSTLPAEPSTSPKTYTHPAELSAYTWINVRFTEIEDAKGYRMVNTLHKCMHCINPACVAACPVGALHKTADGTATVYDDKKCIGCRFCMVACPFGIPTYEWNNPIPFVRKCIFCSDLLEKGEPPACVVACAKRTKCITIGDRDEQLAKARKMVADEPDKYINHIYGEKEVGGTNWLFLTGEPPEVLGLRTVGSSPVPDSYSTAAWGGNWGKLTSFSTDPVPTNAERAMAAVPYVLPGVAVVMSGLYWVFNRKDKLSQERSAQKGGKGVTK